MNCTTLIAQTIIIGGKEVAPAKKSTINTKMDFYQVKDSAKPGAFINYISTGNVIKATIFSETEIKNFAATGAITSLGKISKKPYKDSLVSCIIKSDRVVFFLNKGTALKIWEFPAEVLNIFDNPSVAKRKGTKKNTGRTGSNVSVSNERLTRCLNDCEQTFVDCYEYPFGEEFCTDVFNSCCQNCIHNLRNSGGIAKEASNDPKKAGYLLETTNIAIKEK